ncbi:hypothetical protein [Dietzia sp. 179-F 9C3 NHS]|uniref:hypothetical protein n=1 Tax=Dietzia sp. 179-F 9C3 NHS TaxID=3374295 RepID=UPI003879D5FF
MTTFTRQTHPTSWIGYTANPTKPTAVKRAVDGEEVTVPVRPDVYVREFTSVLIKEITTSGREGRGGTRSVSVTFDASSSETGSDKRLKHDFSASTVEGSDVHKAAAWCHEHKQPVYVAIETRRRYKNKSGEVIPYTTPMHVLRGSEPDGTRANSNITGENCANVIAVIGPADDPAKNIISAEAATDPTEWEQFRHNRDGSTPPEGWVRVFTTDGQPAGAITVAPETPAATAPGATVDAQAVADLILAAMRGDTPERPVQRLRSVEGKQWETVNLDGRLNPASYVVQAIRWTRKDAVDLIQNAAYADPDTAARLGDEKLGRAATDLIKPLMWAADKVQEAAVGYQRQAEPSWREAAKWVAQVTAAEQPYNLAFVEDRHAGGEWIKAVAAAAGELYSMALQIASDIVGAPTDGPSDGGPDGGSGGPTPAPAPQSQAQQPPAPAAEPTGPQAMLADSAELVARWDALIEQVGMAAYVDRLNPILERTFGTHLSTQIPADRFATVLQAWESDPARFWEAAKDAAQATAA